MSAPAPEPASEPAPAPQPSAVYAPAPSATSPQPFEEESEGPQRRGFTIGLDLGFGVTYGDDGMTTSTDSGLAMRLTRGSAGSTGGPCWKSKLAARTSSA